MQQNLSLLVRNAQIALEQSNQALQLCLNTQLQAVRHLNTVSSIVQQVGEAAYRPELSFTQYPPILNPQLNPNWSTSGTIQ